MTSANLVFVAIGLLVKDAICHGIFWDPPNRSTVWRYNSQGQINYNDNALNCGGFDAQHNKNGGKCGLCGDSYTDPHPQDNENTGKYGKGVIAAIYRAGSVIDVKVNLTANHLGKFTFSLCRLDNPHAPESGEHCFRPLRFADGSQHFGVSKNDKHLVNKIQLPKEPCHRCVLRWQYVGGNNWGICSDGSGKLGCGPQETFRSCSDIIIY